MRGQDKLQLAITVNRGACQWIVYTNLHNIKPIDCESYFHFGIFGIYIYILARQQRQRRRQKQLRVQSVCNIQMHRPKQTTLSQYYIRAHTYIYIYSSEAAESTDHTEFNCNAQSLLEHIYTCTHAQYTHGVCTVFCIHCMNASQIAFDIYLCFFFSLSCCCCCCSCLSVFFLFNSNRQSIGVSFFFFFLLTFCTLNIFILLQFIWFVQQFISRCVAALTLDFFSIAPFILLSQVRSCTLS